MTGDEIKRRLRALLAMPEHERPIKIFQLEKLAGLAVCGIYKILRNDGELQMRTITKLERALTLVEENRVEYKRVRNGPRWGPSELLLSPANPPCVAVSRVRFGKDGPKIERVAVNPRSFPVLDEVNRKA